MAASLLHSRFALLFLIGCLALIQSDMVFRDLTCDFSKTLCTTSICKSYKSKGKAVYMDFGCLFTNPLDDVMMDTGVLRKVKNKYEVVFDVKGQDFCELSKMQPSNIFFGRLFNTVRATFKKIKCPLTGNITFKKIPLVFYFAQVILPPSDYIMYTRLYCDNKNLLLSNISFTMQK